MEAFEGGRGVRDINFRHISCYIKYRARFLLCLVMYRLYKYQ